MDEAKEKTSKKEGKGDKLFNIVFVVIIVVAALYYGIQYYMAHAYIPKFEVDGFNFNMNTRVSELEEHGIKFDESLAADNKFPANSWSSKTYKLVSEYGNEFDVYLYNNSPNSSKSAGECLIYHLSYFGISDGAENSNIKLNGFNVIGMTADEVTKAFSSAKLTYDSGTDGGPQTLMFEKAGYTYEFKLEEGYGGKDDSAYRVYYVEVEKDIDKGFEPTK